MAGIRMMGQTIGALLTRQVKGVRVMGLYTCPDCNETYEDNFYDAHCSCERADILEEKLNEIQEEADDKDHWIQLLGDTLLSLEFIDSSCGAFCPCCFNRPFAGHTNMGFSKRHCVLDTLLTKYKAYKDDTPSLF